MKSPQYNWATSDDEQLDVDTVEVAIHLKPEAGRGRKRICNRSRFEIGNWKVETGER